jgi:hypothetical protein
MPREHLTEREVEKLIAAARGNRWGQRDATMILIAFRHGLRASELCELQWSDVAFETGNVIDGFGLSYLEGQSSAPGYVLSTWQTWEALLTIAVRLAYGRDLFASQRAHVLGTRVALPSHKTSRIKVYPDLIVKASLTHAGFIIDAKYKVVDSDGSRISEADIYEAMAFSHATGLPHVVLLYPNSNTALEHATGTVSLFENLQIGSTRILGAHIEVRGISTRQGLTSFSAGLKSGIHTLLS